MLLPANPPDGSVKEIEAVLDPVHPDGVDPDPSAKVRVALVSS